MRTFCVPSHHDICSDPWRKQGVLLVPEMLTPGIWFNNVSTGSISDNRVRKSVDIMRSDNQQRYLLILEVLLEVLDQTDDCVAALSLQWDSHFGRLVLPKRVWMTIYGDDKPLVVYSHLPGHRPIYSILELYDYDVFDKDVWRKRLTHDIKAAASKFEQAV